MQHACRLRAVIPFCVWKMTALTSDRTCKVNLIETELVGFQVLMAACMMMTVSVTWRFARYLHNHSDDGHSTHFRNVCLVSQKAVIVMSWRNLGFIASYDSVSE
jgi:hypothetical protein